MSLIKSLCYLNIIAFIALGEVSCQRSVNHGFAYSPSDAQEARSVSRFTTFNTALVAWFAPYYSFRKPLIISRLKDLQSDVICLQEVWNAQDAEDIISGIKSEFSYSFYSETFDLMKWNFGRNGLLLLSRGPLKNAAYHSLDSFFITRGIITADVKLDGQETTTIGCTHLTTSLGAFPPYLGKYASWENEQEQQAKAITAMGGVNLLMGDMNSGPAVGGTDIKPYSEVAYRYFLNNGYECPYLLNRDPVCTWCANNVLAGSNWGNLIIDHILVDKKLHGGVLAVKRVLDEQFVIHEENDPKSRSIPLSDHFGVTLFMRPLAHAANFRQ